MRQFGVGNLVLCRIPGMQPKLKESWDGPWEVVEKTSEVDYRICLGSKRK